MLNAQRGHVHGSDWASKYARAHPHLEKNNCRGKKFLDCGHAGRKQKTCSHCEKKFQFVAKRGSDQSRTGHCGQSGGNEFYDKRTRGQQTLEANWKMRAKKKKDDDNNFSYY